jgi:hypothetical protein
VFSAGIPYRSAEARGYLLHRKPAAERQEFRIISVFFKNKKTLSVYPERVFS